MEFSGSGQFDIFDVYRLYCDIKSGSSYPYGDGINMIIDESEKEKFSREAVFLLSKMVGTTMNIRGSILDELCKLMSCINIMGDFSEFSRFYDFVFFICRENGQKNITVSRAIAAWKLVLSGRFRLLNQWCDFVEKNQRYNISEDTWRQVLAFSRCVHEDLEGYDPEGAWPTLIDDFVEHMYRITGSNKCSSHHLTCECSDPEIETCASEDPLPGLKNLPGLKRKLHDDFQRFGLEHSSLNQDVINSIISFKRRKQQLTNFVGHGENQPGDVSGEGSQALKVNRPLNASKPPCSVEGCLAKGFAGLLSSAPCLQNQERRVSYTITRGI